MRNYVVSSVAAGLIGGAMLFSGAAPVSALTLPTPAVATAGETGSVELVQNRKQRQQARRGGGERRYDRKRHGKRYSHRRSGYNHRYGNYYYSSPWWIGPSIGFALTVPGYGYGGYGGGYGYGGGGGGHVEWCLNRFRSYDPGSDTYLGYDGYRHRCNSPFG